MFFFVSMIFYDHLILACQIAIITSSLSISVGFAPFHVTKGYRTLGIPWDRIVPQGSPGFNLAKTCLGLLRCLLWDCSCAKVLLLVGMQMMSSSFKGSLEPKTGKEPPKAGNFRKTSIILIILPRFFHLVHLPNLNTIQYHPIPLFWNSVLATAVLRAQDCRIISLSLGATRSFELRRNWHLGSTKRRCAVLQVSFGVISYILYNILITLYAFLQYNLTSSIFGCGFSFAVWHVLEPSLDPRLHGKWGVAGVKNHKEHVWLNIVYSGLLTRQRCRHGLPCRVAACEVRFCWRPHDSIAAEWWRPVHHGDRFRVGLTQLWILSLELDWAQGLDLNIS